MSGPVHGYGEANCVGQRGTEATEAWISHVCVSVRSRKERNGPSGSAGTPAATAHWTIQNRRGASLDRAVAHDRARRPWHHLRSAPQGIAAVVLGLDARSRGTHAAFAQARRHAAPRSALRLAAPGNARFQTGCQVSDGRRFQKAPHARRTGGGNL